MAGPCLAASSLTPLRSQERQLGRRAHARVKFAERRPALIEGYVDGLHRKYRTALEQKDRATARLRRQLGSGAREAEARAVLEGLTLRPGGRSDPRTLTARLKRLAGPE